MTGRRRTFAACGVALAVVLALAVPALPVMTPAPAVAATATPAVFPLADVRPGMIAVGRATFGGDEVRPFGVRVLGVDRNAAGPGRDLIVVQMTREARRETPGLYFGISGAPVYVGKRLLGAMSRLACCGDGLYIGAITPAADMLALLSYGRMAAGTADTGRVTSELAKRAGVPGGVLDPIGTPFVVTGLNRRRLGALEQTLERASQGPVLVTSGRSAPAGRKPSLEPGEPVAVVLASGDVTIGGVGTVTLHVGDRVVMFGHPFFYQGPARFGLAAARTFTVVKDPFWGSYVLAGIGRLAGTVTQDRMSGVVGVLGRDMPATVVRTRLDNAELGTSDATRTLVAQRFQWLPDLVVTSMFAGMDSVFDRAGSGSAQVRWVIRGTRADGTPFTYDRSDLVDSAWDLAFQVADLVYADVTALHGTRLERVKLTHASLSGTMSVRRRTAELTKVTLAAASAPEPVSSGAVMVQPGEVLTLTITLQPGRGPAITKTRVLPAPAEPGTYVLNVRGGAVRYFEDGEQPGTQPETFDELLAKLESAPHSNDIVVRLVAFTETGEQPVGQDVITTKRSISGERSLEIVVLGEDGGELPPEPFE